MIARGISAVGYPRALFLSAGAAASLLLGACSCEEREPWGTTYITTAEAASYAPPACEVDDNAAASAAASGTQVDPNLVEIARLEVERDCYKGAEVDLRQRLQRGAPLK